jgi:hypothetical protein
VPRGGSSSRQSLGSPTGCETSPSCPPRTRQCITSKTKGHIVPADAVASLQSWRGLQRCAVTALDVCKLRLASCRSGCECRSSQLTCRRMRSCQGLRMRLMHVPRAEIVLGLYELRLGTAGQLGWLQGGCAAAGASRRVRGAAAARPGGPGVLGPAVRLHVPPGGTKSSQHTCVCYIYDLASV